ncbi:NAD(P)H-dependent flavin oxidoreductase [Microbacteriaceae bacterium 4G12]
MKYENRVTEKLHISYPIFQAGMAGGSTTPELVAAVSNAGGLGTLGAGYMSPEQMREAIRSVRRQTDQPFAVNLLLTKTVDINRNTLDYARQLLQPVEQKLGITSSSEELMIGTYQDQLEVILEEKVPVCSFAFDMPCVEEIQRLKENGTVIIGTATNVQEGKAWANIGADIIVGQGSEAGGHRGTFIGSVQSSMIGTMALIPQLVDAFSHIPIVAAGGIMDGRGIAASLALGAEGVQLGTAFLTCEESGAHAIHKKEIIASNDQSTTLTRAFSGKYARGLCNDFMTEFQQHERELPDYPILHVLTKEIRQAAAKQQNKEYMSLWAGQASPLARVQPAAMLIKQLVAETDAVFTRF